MGRQKTIVRNHKSKISKRRIYYVKEKYSSSSSQSSSKRIVNTNENESLELQHPDFDSYPSQESGNEQNSDFDLDEHIIEDQSNKGEIENEIEVNDESPRLIESDDIEEDNEDEDDEEDDEEDESDEENDEDEDDEDEDENENNEFNGHHGGEDIQWFDAQEYTFDDRVNEPLYPNAPLTQMESFLLLLHLFLQFCFSKATFDAIIKVVSLHCAEDNGCAENERHFQTFFNGINATDVISHEYCGTCFYLFKKEDEYCPFCPDHPLRYDGKQEEKKMKSFFLEFPFDSELKRRFENPNFLRAINYKFERQKKANENIEDIFDGTEYKKYNILKEYGNLSFTFNTDGVPVFKSGTQQLWPIYMVINELSPVIRFKEENMIIVGIWYGQNKPEFLTYWKPLASRFTKFYEEGFQVQINGEEKTIKGVLLTGTMDNPAKDSVLYKEQYNSKHGCFCKEEGITVANAKGIETIVVHPYKKGQDLLSEEEYRNSALEAEDTKKSVYGYKGISMVELFPHLSYIFAIDYLHTICLGITKKIMTLWFEGDKQAPYYVGKSVDMIDSSLKKLKTPSFITRKPKKIKGNLKRWKGVEFRSWLLYYSAVLMRDILPIDYYNHWLLFVGAMMILLSSSISPNDLNLAEVNLEIFYKKFEELYGLRWCSINVHHVKHLVLVVKKYGPLWTVSCFPFESMNAKLKKLIHGTNFVLHQLLYSTFLLRKMRSLTNGYIENDKIFKFLRSINCKFEDGVYQTERLPKEKIIQKIREKVFAIGKSKGALLTTQIKQMIHSSFGHHHSKIVSFSRANIQGQSISSTSYGRMKMNQGSNVIAYYINQNLRFGMIRSFHLIENNFLFILQPLIPVHQQGKFCSGGDRNTSRGLAPINEAFHPVILPNQNDEIVVIDSVNFHSQCLLIQKNQAEAFVVLRRNSVLELH